MICLSDDSRFTLCGMTPLPYDTGRGMNPAERPIRKKLGEALLTFVNKVMVVADDDVLRELELEKFRTAVEEAARICCQKARSQEAAMA